MHHYLLPLGPIYLVQFRMAGAGKRMAIFFY